MNEKKYQIGVREMGLRNYQFTSGLHIFHPKLLHEYRRRRMNEIRNGEMSMV